MLGAGDIGSLISLAVTETNDSFTNSSVRAQLRLVGTMPVTYNEAGRTFDQMTAQLAETSDDFMNNVHVRRDALHAEIVVLIINNDAYCGCADAIGATPETAFVVVHWGCATGDYSFDQEIGHLLGARHYRDGDSTSTPFAWGHGFVHLAAGAGWRRIMSYNCPSNRCAPRLQYWSSPLSTWGGIAMRTATLEDNHRVWNERAATVAAFRWPGSLGWYRTDSAEMAVTASAPSAPEFTSGALGQGRASCSTLLRLDLRLRLSIMGL